jgi:hypothetical protein
MFSILWRPASPSENKRYQRAVTRALRVKEHAEFGLFESREFRIGFNFHLNQEDETFVWFDIHQEDDVDKTESMLRTLLNPLSDK